MKIILLLIILLSCQKNEVPVVDTKTIEQKKTKTKVNEKAQVKVPLEIIIDESISGISLSNTSSAVRVIGNKFLDMRNSLEPLYLVNKPKTEELELIHHPGSIKNNFSEFILRLHVGADPKKNHFPKITKFVTNRGIKLGMTTKEVIKLLGNEGEMSAQGSKVILRYRVFKENSKFLAKINMPTYFAHYTFEYDGLIEAHWGLEYP